MDNPHKDRFSEVIGGLVSGVAYARSVADMEAMRIAYYYNQHNLLKGMPIPRLRIKRVSISLPIIMSEVIPAVSAVRNPAIDIAKSVVDNLQKAIDGAEKEFADIKSLKKQQRIIFKPGEEELTDRFKKILDIVLQEDAFQRIETQLTDAIEHAYVDLNLMEGNNPPSDASLREKVGQVAEDVVRKVFTEIISGYIYEKTVDHGSKLDPERAKKTIQELMGHEITIRLIHNVRHAAENNAVIAISIPPDFYVSVNTADVKNTGGGSDTVTRLDMVLYEEGLEWVTEECDGKKVSKLTQE
jgi:hypothetical protein